MPSVRDLFGGGRSDAKQQTPAEGTTELLSGPAQGAAPTVDEHAEIMERLRQGADQKAALAKLEIERQQQKIEQLEGQLDDLHQQGQPAGEVSGQLENARIRLDDAKDDLARAEEAKANISAAMSPSRGEVPAHLDHDQGMGSADAHEAKNNVRSALGSRGQNTAGSGSRHSHRPK